MKYSPLHELLKYTGRDTALAQLSTLDTAPVNIANQFTGALTGIRSLAALMVLAHHIFALAGPRVLSFDIGNVQITYHWLLTVSWLGANVFFVLSGFLLAIPFARHIENKGGPVTVGAYLIRRVKRVAPAYWSQIVILVSVLYFSSALPAWQVIAAHFLFLQNFWPNFAFALNGVYWTLPTEFGYYLLLPIFAACSARFFDDKRQAWLAISGTLIITAVTYRWLMFAKIANDPVSTKFFVLLQLPGVIDHFAIGMLLAWVYVRYSVSVSSRVSDALVVVGLAGIVSMMALFDHVYTDYWNGHVLLFVGHTIAASFIGTLVLGAALSGPIARILFANRAMLFVGMISFSLYLWHLPIIRWTMTMLDHFAVTGDRLWWLVVIVVPLSLIAATISYYCIERPFMARKSAA